MASTYTVTLSIKEDGNELVGFPLTKTLTVDESKGSAVFTRPDSASFTDLDLAEIGEVNLLFVNPSLLSSLRFNDQSDGGLPINADGFLLAFNCAIPSGASSKASLQTNTGSAATVRQVAGG